MNESLFAILAALCAFLLSASAAPAGSQDACSEIRTSSIDLNQHAKTASTKARNGSTDLARFSSTLAWIEENDMCDPASLKEKPVPCVQKIAEVLEGYASKVEMISAFESCSKLTSNVRPALKKLHKDMKKCMKSLGVNSEREPNERKVEHPSVDHWKQALVCRYTLERLFSFSILTARVFAVGDPGHHSGSSAQRCS